MLYNQRVSLSDIAMKLKERFKNNKNSKIVLFAMVFALVGSALLLVANANTTNPYANNPAVRSLALYSGYGTDNTVAFHQRIEEDLGRKSIRCPGKY